MRHALTVLLAVCCLGVFSYSSYSQTADELIAKNIQARGGMEKIKAIKTLRMTGKFDGGGGFTASVGQENQRPEPDPRDILAAGHDCGGRLMTARPAGRFSPLAGKKIRS